MARRRRPSQIALPFRPTGRGGARPGAGRPRTSRFVSHSPRPHFDGTRTPLHVTVRMAPQVWNLRSERGFACVARALAREQSRGELRIVHYSVQGNHLHMIVETADRDTLARRMQGFGVRLARAVNTMMRRRRGRVLGDRYHSRVLATPREVHRAVRYVLQNHAKHAASWSPRDAIPRTPPATRADRFSSAVTRTIVVTSRAGPRASVALVSSASSWLLRRGLQRGAPRVAARGSS